MRAFFSKHPVLAMLVCLASGGLALLAGLVYYGFSNPPTPAEKKKTLPGDELLGGEPDRLRGGLAITIEAPPEKVWPYLAQLGQDRAGFYSFDWLERLFGFHIYNVYHPVAGWQHVSPGQYLFYHQNGIGSQVQAVKPGAYLTTLSDSRRPSGCEGSFAFVPPFGLDYFAWSWNFILEEAGPGRTRLHTRCDAAFAPFDGLRRGLVAFFLGVPSHVMCKSMLKTIKACVESEKPHYEP